MSVAVCDLTYLPLGAATQGRDDHRAASLPASPGGLHHCQELLGFISAIKEKKFMLLIFPEFMLRFVNWKKKNNYWQFLCSDAV